MNRFHLSLKKRYSAVVNNKKSGPVIGFLLLSGWLIYVSWTEYIGINFGSHWDEWKILSSVRDSFSTGLFLPNWYNYPSFSYDLAVVAAIVRYLSEWGNIAMCVVQNLETFPGVLGIFIRVTFMLTTLLSAVWVYVVILAWRSCWQEALFGAVLLSSSWEVAYHARWIAPDGIMMQFGMASTAALLMGLRKENASSGWIRLGAFIAGFACGSKYPGGIMLLPVILSEIITKKKSG